MIRLLDLNAVSYLHSQTIYHAVAYCTTAESPGTIIILRPEEPYVCVGYHQLLEKVIDVDYCRQNGVPIIRREVGGGAVFLDNNQLFFQCIFPLRKAPKRVDKLYKFFLKPAVNTYRKLGIDAYYRPVNDIQVDEKKICGTGAGRIEGASVVVGNLLFDFNYGEMARILRVSSEKFRDKIYDSMQLYLTTLRRELGYLPDQEKAKDILIKEFEKLLGCSLYSGSLTSEEQQMLASIDKKFTDPDWLYEKGGKLTNWIKISADVNIVESVHKSPGGLIWIILRLKGDTIDDIVISGDFTIQPQKAISGLEHRLRGQPHQAEPLLKTITSYYKYQGIDSPGVTPEDILKVIMVEKN
jgi:lipoate-protein ligase A